MFPLTRFLSCTDPIDGFDSLSPHQQRHAKAYVTGLIAATNNKKKQKKGEGDSGT